MPELSTKIKYTPMLEQYLSIHKTLPENTILFFRMGDFYEMFFEDAVKASEILGITLTARSAGEAGKAEMCGMPYHSSQAYIRTLIENNLKVAICEQVGDPKAAKGLVERKISRIVTPATYLEDESKGKETEYMVAIAQDAKQTAFAYLEMSTGEFYVRQIPSPQLMNELSILNPREVILPQTLSQKEILTKFIKNQLDASVTVYEDWVFTAEEGTQLLKDSFKLASEKSISFREEPLAVSAVGGILYYLRDHLHHELSHVRKPELLNATEFMALERTTQRSLELVCTQQGKKGAETLLGTIDQTLTSMGARALYNWVTHPLLVKSQIQNRQDAVTELLGKVRELSDVRMLLKGIKDIERTVSRLNYGVANARDLINLVQCIEKMPTLKSVLLKMSTAMIEQLNDAICLLPDMQALIKRSITEAPPLTVRDGGLIRDGFSAELDDLRQISSKGKTWILEFQKREIEKTGIKNLRVKYSGVFGYTIEISKGQLNAVPADYIRRQTLANAERFVVPELKEWDEKISGAQDKIKALEYEIFNEVRETVLKELIALQKMSKALGDLDALASLAFTALNKNWTKPTIVESGELMIEGGRHAVVESMLPSGKFVENDSFLDTAENQLIVLTGPNMAGKSTYIRQIGLIVILAQIGSYVPANAARVGIVDQIFTRIGASDDLAAGESTFMVEMVETANILQKATSKSLIILDEVGRGTSTFDGVSIAWAICEHLVQGTAKPRTLFATHYHELTQLEEHFKSVKNYHITVKEAHDDIIFLRKVARGGADRSYGIHVARLAGIPKSVTDRSRKILQVLESENTEATQIIEGKKKNPKVEDSSPSLFDWAQRNHPVVDELKELSLDGMSPLQALNKLAEWKERLQPDN